MLLVPTEAFRRMETYLKKLILSVGSIAHMSVYVEAQPREDWQLEKDKNGIQVFTRHLPGSRLKEIKLHGEMTGTLTQLVAFFSDVDQYSKVLYKNKTARLIRQVSETELYYYAESQMPWPATNRDLVVQLRFGYDKASGTLHINTTSVPDLIPPKNGIERVSVWQAAWLVRPVSEKKMLIDYTCQVDPGGKLPAWLVNATVAIGPYETFLSIQEKIQLPRYQGRSFRFMTPSN
jgi:hypothetical protein